MIRVKKSLFSDVYAAGPMIEFCQMLPSGDINYSVPLLSVHDNETMMTGGRFHSYSPEEQRYVVTLPFPSVKAVIEQRIEWIAEHAKGTWNLNVTARHVGDLSVHYSFAELRDGCLFKLLFGLNLGFAD